MHKEKGKKAMQENLPRSCSPLCILHISIVDVPVRNYLPSRSAHATPSIPDRTPVNLPQPHINHSRRASFHTTKNMQRKEKKKGKEHCKTCISGG
jgi:hypothetical protein